MIFLRGVINELRTITNPVLPEGCPFVVGGGLVRDGLLGGRPGDIDVWLPTNITADTGITEFETRLRRWKPDAVVTLLFAGPGSRGNPSMWTGQVLAEAGETYGDVNNNWVIEVQVEGWPKINFMRSMTPWSNDTPASFFTGLMRGFDIDACMFFVGWMPDQRDVYSVILPRHMLNRGNGTTRLMMNELYWNQYRMNNTSAARVRARLIKMYSKYNWSIRSPEELAQGFLLPTSSIEATAITIYAFVNRYLLRFPSPTGFNRREVSVEDWEQDVMRVTRTLDTQIRRFQNQVRANA